MKNRLKQIIVWCMVAALLCVNCSFTSEAKTGSKVKVSKTSITSVKSKSAGQATVTFKKQKKASSYQIQISTDKKFKKGVKSQKVSARKKTVTFKKLKQGKKYYASTNPSAGAHESLAYKDADGNIVYIDAQGRMARNSCEEHGCLDKVIRD